MKDKYIHTTKDISAQVFENRQTGRLVVLFSFTHETLDKLKEGFIANTSSEHGSIFVFAAGATIEEANERLEPLSPVRPRGH
jgi:hypothetical protein